ncbi:hypothetical protein [Rhizobium sp. NXC24]|uniref:hypothetical protein n=1 Tax=Rhizobium sp. NXC24 TaxID=2048897 RepID=UPI000CDF3A3B|nr:hypothetical protein [Rhizobium sp. NXC24]AVA20671.1 hypothetical protein NXC24_CH01004 [Rhizobium sp. NXC24]
MADRIAYRQPQVGNQGFARTVKTLGGVIAIVAADEATGNTVQLMKVPKGFVVTGVYLALTDIDTNGTPTVSVSLGDAGNDSRFVAASTIGQAGGSTTTLAAAGLYYEFTVETSIALKFQTGSATAADGTATCYLTGFMK